LPVTPAEALRRARLAGRLGQFEVSPHARKRMKERRVTRSDLMAALGTTTHAAHEGQGRFLLTGGVDIEGQALAVVIAIDPGCVVITLF
jgi:hypothetical protein